jgi:hypothetical protein
MKGKLFFEGLGIKFEIEFENREECEYLLEVFKKMIESSVEKQVKETLQVKLGGEKDV